MLKAQKAMIEMSKWYDREGVMNRLQLDAIGKVISQIWLKTCDDYYGDVLNILFTDGTGIAFFDDGQNCCEHRYMSVDGDDLSEFIGAKYVEAFVNEAPSIEDEYGDHEVQFLEIRTSKGSITLSNHNEHNGYYGGFSVVVKSVEKE